MARGKRETGSWVFIWGRKGGSIHESGEGGKCDGGGSVTRGTREGNNNIVTLRESGRKKGGRAAASSSQGGQAEKL